MNGVCKKTSITGDMPTYGVPEDAKYETSEYIGAELPNLGVLVNEYNRIVREHSIYLSSYAPVGDGEVCVPVMISELLAKPRLALILT